MNIIVYPGFLSFASWFAVAILSSASTFVAVKVDGVAVEVEGGATIEAKGVATDAGEELTVVGFFVSLSENIIVYPGRLSSGSWLAGGILAVISLSATVEIEGATTDTGEGLIVIGFFV